jgi:hypothetical protein
VWALVCLIAVVFERAAPGAFGSFIGGLIAGQSGGAHLDLEYVGTFAWLGVLAFSIRYFQAAVRLERDYKYVHSIEAILASEFPAPSFTREGTGYLQDYPLFSNWVQFLYTVALPVGVAAVAVSRAVDVWAVADKPPRLWSDFLLSLLLLVSVVLYSWTLHARAVKAKVRGWRGLRTPPSDEQRK